MTEIDEFLPVMVSRLDSYESQLHAMNHRAGSSIQIGEEEARHHLALLMGRARRIRNQLRASASAAGDGWFAIKHQIDRLSVDLGRLRLLMETEA